MENEFRPLQSSVSKFQSIDRRSKYDIFKEITPQIRAILLGEGIKEWTVDNWNCIIASLRILRNCCVQNSQVQQELCESGTTELIRNFLLKTKEERNEIIATIETSLWKMSLQLFVNAAAGNVTTQGLLWQQLFPSFFESVLEIGNRELLGILSALCYTCVCHSLAHRKELLSPAGISLLRSLILATLVDGKVAEDNIVEWIHFLINRLTRDNLVSNTFDSLADIKESTEPGSVSDGQLILLKLLDAQFYASPLLSEDILSMIPWLVQLFSELYTPTVDSALIISPEEENVPMNVSSNDVESLFLILQIFGNLTSYTNQEYHQPIIDSLSQQGMFQMLVELLSRARKTELKLAEGEKKKKPNNIDPDKADTQNFSFGFKRDLIRIIGNMCYRNRVCQDQARELEAIPLLLDHCKVDTRNPYIREWSIMALRNVCEGNVENQAIVGDLKVLEVAPSEELEELGLQAEVQGTKVKITRADF